MADLRVGIIGAGLIGGKRASAMNGGKLIAVADISLDRATLLASRYGAEPTVNWRDIVNRKDVDAIIVATSNDAITECSQAALRAGKHVLVEKTRWPRSR